jgi:uncharacterized membrane protein
MTVTTDPNVWIIYALIFILGLLIGVFLTAGGRRKWKSRYQAEVDRRREVERERDQRAKDLDEREKEWRERDSLRSAAIKSGRDPTDDRPL